MPSLDQPDYQPPLTRWGHAWRVLAALAISALAWFELAVWQWEHDPAWFWVDLGAGLICLVAMHYRRRWPAGVVVLTIACGLFSASAAGPATVVLASVATRRRWREIIPVTLASVVQVLFFEMVKPIATDPWPVTATAGVLVVGVTVAVGMYIGSRRELLHALHERAETAEAEQSSRVAQARIAERARIAREMHDVLAHRISLVAMHAGGLAYRSDLSAEEVRQASSVIQDNAHRALSDLRDVLGILREDSPDSVLTRPQPDWRDLPALVAEARAAGMKLTYADHVGEPTPPERIGRTAYRIVQEALTNARKHAPDTVVEVEVSGNEVDGVAVRVRNPLRIGSRVAASPPSGLGLIGLEERAELSGGSLTHRQSDDGGFVLEARLPWSA